MRPIQRIPTLRRVEDRRRDVDGMDAAVRDGERAAGEVVGRERALARARAASSAIRSLISSSESRSAPATTGATSPSSVSTATATLISASSSTSVSVTRALRTGCSRSAAATSLTTIAVTPIRGDAPASFSRARSSTSGLTSSSSTEVSWAAVWRLETMRVAIVPRRPRSGIVACDRQLGRPRRRRLGDRLAAPPPTRRRRGRRCGRRARSR